MPRRCGVNTGRRLAIASGCLALAAGLWLAPPAAPRTDVAAAVTLCPWQGTPLPIDPCGDRQGTPSASPAATPQSSPETTTTPTS
jgi:hypothetical protein